MNVICTVLFLLLFLIICSIFFKSIEGFNDKFYYDKLIDFKTIPNSYVNDSTPSRTINKFGFYKGEGTFKKGYSEETKSDDKISTLNKLLNRLLGRIVSDNNDCVGEFGKYSACNKSCGSNAYQTRTYNISQERGKHGLDCAFEEGYKEKKRCAVDECQLGDICENNADCGTGNCGANSTRCENMVPCDTENVNVCDEDECIKLNGDDNDGNDNGDNDDVKMLDGVYIYNNVDEECFFKTPAEIEELNLNIYTYDYRTISTQVQNLVLDCEYYQVKKDGVGPCINGSNITIFEGNPKCILGFGPEPTIFNGSYACKECLIKNTEGGGCHCENGMTFDRGICTVDASGSTNNVCDDEDDKHNYIKYKNASGECNLCGTGTSFKRDSNNISCVPCPDGSRTLSDYCSASCSSRDTDNQFCPSLCGGLAEDDQFFVDEFEQKWELNLTRGGSSTEYQENCLNIFDAPGDLDEVIPSECSVGKYLDDKECLPCSPHTACPSPGSNCVTNHGEFGQVPDSDGPHPKKVQSCNTMKVPRYLNIRGELYPCSSASGDCVIYNNPKANCPAGQGAAWGGECTQCSAGTYNENGSGECLPCASGKWQELRGQTECNVKRSCWQPGAAAGHTFANMGDTTTNAECGDAIPRECANRIPPTIRATNKHDKTNMWNNYVRASSARDCPVTNLNGGSEYTTRADSARPDYPADRGPASLDCHLDLAPGGAVRIQGGMQYTFQKQVDGEKKLNKDGLFSVYNQCYYETYCAEDESTKCVIMDDEGEAKDIYVAKDIYEAQLR